MNTIYICCIIENIHYFLKKVCNRNTKFQEKKRTYYGVLLFMKFRTFKITPCIQIEKKSNFVNNNQDKINEVFKRMKIKEKKQMDTKYYQAKI